MRLERLSQKGRSSSDTEGFISFVFYEIVGIDVFKKWAVFNKNWPGAQYSLIVFSPSVSWKTCARKTAASSLFDAFHPDFLRPESRLVLVVAFIVLKTQANVCSVMISSPKLYPTAKTRKNSKERYEHSIVLIDSKKKKSIG